MNNFPDSPEDIVDILAKAGYLKASNDKVELSMKDSKTMDIQIKDNIFGTQIELEDDGNLALSLTFDTKKLRNSNHFDAKKSIDIAIKSFLEDSNV